MFKLSRDVFINIATICLLTAFISCGGNIAAPVTTGGGGLPPSMAASGFPQALPVDHAQPWERLDATGRVIPRAASSINVQSEFVPGAERDSAGGDVADYGEASTLNSGGAGLKALSYAVYRIPLGAAQPGAVAADVNLRLQTGGTGLSGYWLGLSNYSAGRWDWSGPYSDSHVRLSTGAAVAGGRSYTSALGNLYLCVVAFDGASFDIVGVGENSYDGADATPPPAPAGLTATPVAGGLSLQWNSVIAADLAGYRIYWRQAAFSDPHSPGVAQVNYVEGAARHVLLLPNTASHSAAVSAVDLSGNESAISPVAAAAPLAGSAPTLQVTVDTVSVKRLGAASLTAIGASSYDFDLNGDGVFDLTNATGIASVDTSATGLIRPLVRGTGGGSMEALGGVSLIVLGNTRPVASAIASPQTGVAPLSVTFTGTGEDIEDLPASLAYAWDFEGDGVYEAGTNTLTPPAHVYPGSGTFNCKFRVTDSQGAWDVDTVAIVVTPKTGVDSTVAVASLAQYCISSILAGGVPAIAYADQSSNYAITFIRANRADGSAWRAPVVVYNETNPIQAISMAMVNGNPAIVYADNATTSLKYVRATTAQGTAWGAPVTVAGVSADFCELVVAAGNPAIGYYDSNLAAPFFVRASDVDGAAWAAPVIAGAAGTGKACATAIVSGNPALAYADNISITTLYCRATSADGSTWGAPQLLSPSTVTEATDLQVIGGLPCVVFGSGASGVMYIVRSVDATGSVWSPPVIALQRTSGAMTPSFVSMASFGGHPAIAVADGSDASLWYAEATDPTCMQWGIPVVIAPYVPGNLVDGNAVLLNLSGTAGIAHAYYDMGVVDRQLWFSRKYR